MQTQIAPESASALEVPPGPCLEQAVEGQPPQRVMLETYPFRIGRVAPADLKIDLGRVSREHALVHCEAGVYRIQDLGSTNGTFINGEQIDEGVLRDGDLLAIADVEFTFRIGDSSARDVATQVLGRARPRDASYLDVMHGVRRLHEALTHRCVKLRFEPIVRIEDREVLGYEAVESDPREVWSATVSSLSDTECRLTRRIFQLERLIAAEKAAGLGDAVVFVKVAPTEVGSEDLVESLLHVRRVLVDRQRLAVQLPDSVVSDTPLLQAFFGRLRQASIAVAHDGFAAGAGQVRQLRAIAPDSLRLAPALVLDVHRNRKRREHLQKVVEAAGEIGAQVIAAGVRCAEEAETCQQAGCQFAQGEGMEPRGGVDQGSGHESRVTTENLSY